MMINQQFMKREKEMQECVHGWCFLITCERRCRDDGGGDEMVNAGVGHLLKELGSGDNWQIDESVSDDGGDSKRSHLQKQRRRRRHH